MPVSRNRKNHKTKVAKRRENMVAINNANKKLFQEMMMKQIEEMKEKFTESKENEDNQENGPIQPTENI